MRERKREGEMYIEKGEINEIDRERERDREKEREGERGRGREGEWMSVRDIGSGYILMH